MILNRDAPNRKGALLNEGTERRSDGESIAFIVRYRCDVPPSENATPRCQVEVEDVDAGDKRRFVEFDKGVEHMRTRIETFIRRRHTASGPQTLPG